ncbi:lipopolysaccharide biosynthesis protein [Shewanella youngdeokensis]|uniref:Lipopolysaccharide biosynthesis protein n=1 Tax=Shewanella youngdeokensis TaxID=2999068 RepID=A0ABZ0K158_9GAMM|nr:lipopolysaccharide biosynthesis protein [Shewanella sp. DAU334]
MSNFAVEKVEKRFQKLARTSLKDILNDVPKLLKVAKEIEAEDVALAKRIVERAKKIYPTNGIVDNELKRLTTLVNSLIEAEKSKMQMIEQPSVKADEVNSSIQKNVQDEPETITSPLNSTLQHLVKPWVIFLVLPFAIFSFYQIVWASVGYESRAQLIVQQPDGLATMDSSLAMLSGLGVSSPSSSDLELVKAYVHSQDMFNFLEQETDFTKHFSESNVDFFSRLHSWSTKEDKYSYYLDHVAVEIDEKSAVITITVRAFDGEFAHELNNELVKRAEWFINSIGHQLAEEQLKFINNEHQLVELKLKDAKTKLLNFQQDFNLLDPQAEGLAMQQITYSIEANIATQEAELKSLQKVMTDKAPQVIGTIAKISALKQQLEYERNRLSMLHPTNINVDKQQVQSNSVSEVLSKYSSYKIALELALQSYTASQVSLEKARIEAYRQLKYLMVVEAPTLPEDNQYPKVVYNLSLFAALQLMLFGIGRIILATVKELG